MDKRIKIIEVAPRDGFQILPVFIPTEVKADLINSLIEAGCDEIEASSFVSGKWVPQLRDAEDLCRSFQSRPVFLTYLVPNMQGARRAIDAGAKHIFVTTSASATHCRENLNQTVDEVFDGAEKIAGYARENKTGVTASIAASFGYSRDPEGVSEARVLALLGRLEDAGFSSVTLCDTSGEADPTRVFELCSAAIQKIKIPIGVHLHQRDGIEFANACSALQAGVRTFESAAGGLGGCPYIPKAKGNIATEKLVRMFHEMGYSTKIDLNLMDRCAAKARQIQMDHSDCKEPVS